MVLDFSGMKIEGTHAEILRVIQGAIRFNELINSLKAKITDEDEVGATNASEYRIELNITKVG